MKKSFCLLVSAIFLSVTSICFAQEMNLDEILKNHYEIMGINKQVEVKTFISSGKMIQQGMEFPYTLYQKRSGLARLEIDFQGQKIIQACNEETAWYIHPLMGIMEATDMPEADNKELRKRYGDIEGPLYNWEEKGHKLELIGTDEMEGTEVYRLKLSEADEQVSEYFIDAESFVLLKSTEEGPQGTTESYYSNYMEKDDIVYFGNIDIRFSGMTVMTITIDNIEFNPEIDDSIFQKPVKE